MLRMTIKGLLARKRRLFTTGFAVTLAVAFMTGTLVLSDTLGRTFDNLFADAYANTDVQVRQEAAFEGPQGMGTQRGRVDESLVVQLRSVDGVAVAEGDVFGYARLLGRDGKPIGNPDMGAPTIGSIWSDSALNPFKLVEGRTPGAGDEVVIDRKSASDGGLGVGDTTTVLVQAGPRQVRIAGIATWGKADSAAGSSFTLFDPAVGQQVLAEPGKFDSVSLIAQPGVSDTDLLSRVRAVLPEGLEALTGAEVTKENQDLVEEAFLSFFNVFMLVFAVVGLLVGAFMIFNTFSITVAQRTRENGLLRALGASRRHVLSSVLWEAALVGVVASLLGLVGGLGMASLLQGMLASAGVDIPTGGVVFSATTAYVALLAGITVTVVAAVSPARKAAKIPPIAAMQTQAVGSTGYGSKQRVMVGLVLLAAGVSGIFVALFADPSNALALLGASVLAVFFGVSVLARTVSLPLIRLLGVPLPRLGGTAAVLARANAMRNPKRTAASASALMISVGLVGFITILASSAKTSTSAAIDRSVTGDIVVTSGAGFFGGVDPGLATRLNELPEVASAAGVRMGPIQVAGEVELAGAVDVTTAFEVIDVEPLQGNPRDLGRNAIGVHKDLAASRGIGVGDEVTVLFKDTGEQALRVALIFGREDALHINGIPTPYLLGMEAYDANFGDRYDFTVYVEKQPAISVAAAVAAVEVVAKDYPGVKVFDQAGFKADQAEGVNRILGIVYALLAMAVVIAVLGIANTLKLSILERTNELGLLRAVGMTRSQLRRCVGWESVLIALQGTALGLVVAVFFGWALVTGLADQGIDRFDLPLVEMAVIAVLGALAGVLSAAVPSRRAARLNVLQAIADR